MGRDQLRHLKELEKENLRLRRAVSDLALDKQIGDRGCNGPYCKIMSGSVPGSTHHVIGGILSASPANSLH